MWSIAFLLNGLSFLVIAAILWTLPPSRPGRKTAEAAEAEAARRRSRARRRCHQRAAPAGATQRLPVVTTPAPAGLRAGLIQFVIGFFDGGIQALTVILAVTVLNAGEQANGYLNAAIGVGGLIGAVVSGVLVLRRRLRPAAARRGPS